MSHNVPNPQREGDRRRGRGWDRSLIAEADLLAAGSALVLLLRRISSGDGGGSEGGGDDRGSGSCGCGEGGGSEGGGEGGRDGVETAAA